MESNNQANNSIIVISPQYCGPSQVDLYTAKKVKKVTKKKFLGAFDINGNNVFKITTSSHDFFRSLRILVDAAGVPVVTLKQVILSMHQRWKVYKGDGTEPRDLLFTVKKSNLVIKTEFDVYLAFNAAEDICDFKIRQTSNGKSVVIYRGYSEDIIAEMHENKAVREKVRGKNTFSVTVSPNVDYAFIIAMVAVVDEINIPPRAVKVRTGGLGPIGY